MKYFIFAAILLLSVSMVAAETVELPDNLEVDRNEIDLDRVKQVVNSNTDQVPDFVASLVGGQKINLYLESDSYSKTIKIDMKGTRIETIDKGEWSEPSLEIWLEAQEANELISSEEPFKELRNKLKSREIEYREHGFVNSLKFFVLELFL